MKFIKLENKEYLTLPETPGVYIFKQNKKPIYVGKAKNLKSRVSSYFAKTLLPKTRAMVSKADLISYVPVASEFEALLLEAKLVKKLKPHYNIELRDDKSPLYVGITDEDLPRILSLRQTQLPTVKLKNVYGPFINSGTVKFLLINLRKVVSYSTHKPGKKPCVLYEIGLCDPCPTVDLNHEQRRMYKKNVLKIKNIMSGKFQTTLNMLRADMQDFSKDLEFENSQKALNQIKALESLISQQQRKMGEYLKNPNLLEEIREKELQSLGKYLEEFFEIDKLSRIECFDIAHIAGSFPTASMVTFINGEANKNYYRQFKVNQKKSQSDLDSMKEILSRRRKRLKDWGKPDLMIIDGGKGQIKVAKEIFPDIAVVGLAKRFETLVFYENGEYYERRVKPGPALALVQRIRDEAHRFARRYHHKLVKKALIEQ